MIRNKKVNTGNRLIIIMCLLGIAPEEATSFLTRSCSDIKQTTEHAKDRIGVGTGTSGSGSKNKYILFQNT